MMSVEGPFLTALIARMSEPEYNLAAYGVAFAFALIVESPVIMMMSASTALVEGRDSFYKLKNFVYSVNGIVTAFILVLLIPSVFYTLTVDLINLPVKVAELTHTGVLLLIPWAPSIGYRRFYQGILIRGNATRRVAYGTVIRLSSMGITAFVLYLSGNVSGVIVGSAALSAGVMMEALATKYMARNAVRNILKNENDPGRGINYGDIIKFYYPLALTSIISLGVHPIVTFLIGQSRMALESLAVLPVINSLIFIFRSFGLSFQEVGIALMGKQNQYRILRNFAAVMGVCVVLALAAITFTPLSQFWFANISGLSEELTSFSEFPAMIYTIFPALTVWINFQRSILVYDRNTQPITYATVIEVGGILLVLFAAIKLFGMVGVVAAIAGYTVGRLSANIYLIKHFKLSLKKILG